MIITQAEMETRRELRDLTRKIRQALAELEVMSELPAAVPGKRSASAEDDVGGRQPPQTIERPPRDDDERDDWSAWPHKDAEHFRRRVQRATTASALRAILKDLEATLRARRRAPVPSAPALGDPMWKRWVGQSTEKTADLARRFDVSPQYVNRVRREYRERRPA